MVYAFVVAEIQRCELLYSSVFDFGDSPKRKTPDCGKGFINTVVNEVPNENGLSCNENISKVVRIVKEEYNFNCSISGESSFGTSVPTLDQIDVETRGVMSIRVNSTEKTILWRACYGILFILICDKTENRMLAARTLVQLIRSILDHIPKIASSPSEIILKGDIVSAIVNTFLPCGQLLFLHSSAIQQLNKDLNKVVSK